MKITACPVVMTTLLNALDRILNAQLGACIEVQHVMQIHSQSNEKRVRMFQQGQKLILFNLAVYLLSNSYLVYFYRVLKIGWNIEKRSNKNKAMADAEIIVPSLTAEQKT